MGIQSSINSLLSQAQSLAAFYKGFEKADDFIKGQEAIVKGQKEQTESTKSLQEAFDKNRINSIYNKMFDSDGKLTEIGKQEAQIYYNDIKKGVRFEKEINDIYNDPRVQDYLKSINEKIEKNERTRAVLFSSAPFDSVIEAQSPNSELKNEVARKVAKMSVKSRTNNINKSKADFKKHLIGVKKDKGSELN